MDGLEQIALPHAVKAYKAIDARRELQSAFMDVLEVEDVDVVEDHKLFFFTESEVAGIAESGHNIAVGIDFIVDCSYPYGGVFG